MTRNRSKQRANNQNTTNKFSQFENLLWKESCLCVRLRIIGETVKGENRNLPITATIQSIFNTCIKVHFKAQGTACLLQLRGRTLAALRPSGFQKETNQRPKKLILKSKKLKRKKQLKTNLRATTRAISETTPPQDSTRAASLKRPRWSFKVNKNISKAIQN